jgi:hypothetical protein
MAFITEAQTGMKIHHSYSFIRANALSGDYVVAVSVFPSPFSHTFHSRNLPLDFSVDTSPTTRLLMAQDAAGTAADPAQTHDTDTQVAHAPAAAAATVRTVRTGEVSTRATGLSDVVIFPKR